MAQIQSENNKQFTWKGILKYFFQAMASALYSVLLMWLLEVILFRLAPYTFAWTVMCLILIIVFQYFIMYPFKWIIINNITSLIVSGAIIILGMIAIAIGLLISFDKLSAVVTILFLLVTVADIVETLITLYTKNTLKEPWIFN